VRAQVTAGRERTTNHGVFENVVVSDELHPIVIDNAVKMSCELLVCLAVIFVVVGRDLEDVARCHDCQVQEAGT